MLTFIATFPHDWTVGPLDNDNNLLLNFTTFDKENTTSAEPIIINIMDDSFAESSESLICNIQTGVVDSVQSDFPKQVTIQITDNEGKKGGYLYRQC